jgi:hypothetical protein
MLALFVASALAAPAAAMDQKTCAETITGTWKIPSSDMSMSFTADGRQLLQPSGKPEMELGIWGIAEGQGGDDCLVGAISNRDLDTKGISFVEGKLKWGDMLFERVP